MLSILASARLQPQLDSLLAALYEKPFYRLPIERDLERMITVYKWHLPRIPHLAQSTETRQKMRRSHNSEFIHRRSTPVCYPP
jgi:hypothetical protein